MPLTYATPPKHTWPSFIKLVDAMEEAIGLRKACALCGIQHANFSRIKSGHADLTNATAKKILAGYKKFKAGESA